LLEVYETQLNHILSVLLTLIAILCTGEGAYSSVYQVKRHMD